MPEDIKAPNKIMPIMLRSAAVGERNPRRERKFKKPGAPRKAKSTKTPKDQKIGRYLDIKV